MPAAHTIRLQIEASLAHKIPSALTLVPKMIRPVASTGLAALDEVLHGGLPVGAVSELVGPECSGRTSVALSSVACLTRAGKACAWIDVSNAFDPESAAGAGADLGRLLWVRCGVVQKSVRRTNTSFALPAKCWTPEQAKKGLHGGGFGPHPRTEAKGLSKAVHGLLQAEASRPRCAEPQRRVRPQQKQFEPSLSPGVEQAASSRSQKPWAAMDQALRVADLLLQAGGFSAIVLDMGSVAPEYVSRVPLATWFRYRAAAERTQSSVLLLTQYACAKSSAELLLRFQPAEIFCDEITVFTGMERRVELARRRFAQIASNVVPMRKPPQSEHEARWRSRTPWAGCR